MLYSIEFLKKNESSKHVDSSIENANLIFQLLWKSGLVKNQVLDFWK